VTGEKTVINYGSPRTAYIALPEFFFLYTDAAYLAALPPRGVDSSINLLDTAENVGAADSGDVEPDDVADDRAATNLATIDSRAMFMAFTWLKLTLEGSLSDDLSSPFQFLCVREPWDTGADEAAGCSWSRYGSYTPNTASSLCSAPPATRLSRRRQ
jgi:hypothetical protein